MERIKELDICIVTFNRLLYLQKCIWSIIASTKVKYRIFVVDDMSTDGTDMFLYNMKKRNLIHEYVINEKKYGSAGSLNRACNMAETEWFTFCNDDMWFHLGWDSSAISIIKVFDYAAMISMSNFTGMKLGTNATELKGCMSDGSMVIKLDASCLSATMINKEVWEASGKFVLPKNKLMGYFAGNYCNHVRRLEIKRRFIYMPVPQYVINMDMVSCKLNERDNLSDYCKFRKGHKK